MARTKERLTAAERRAAAEAATKRKETPTETDERNKLLSLDPINLDDHQLLESLRKLGANVGPINDSTRSLYMRRLGKLIKQRGIENLDQIEEEEDKGETKGTKPRAGPKKEEVREKPKKKGRAEQRITEDIEEKGADEEVEPKKKKVGRQRKRTAESEEKAEPEATVPVQKNGRKTMNRKVSLARVDGRGRSDEEEKAEEEEEAPEATVPVQKNGRKTMNRKVSLARVDGRGRSDEEEKAEEEEEAVRLQVATKKRDSSVQILAVRTKADQKKEIHGKGIEKNRRTIVIDEDDEESDEENSELNTLIDENENGEEGMEDENTLHSIILNGRESRRIIERIDEEEEENQEDDETIRRIDDVREESEMDLVPSDAEDENGGAMEKKREEELPPRRTMVRPLLEVDTPDEPVRRGRSSRRRDTVGVGREEKEENDEERRRTIDIFNRKPRNSHRSTLDIIRGRVSHEESRTDGRMVRPHANVPQILEESEDMEISPRQGEPEGMDISPRGEATVGQKKNLTYKRHSEGPRRRLGDLSRPLFLDDSNYMDISDAALDQTLTLRGQGDTFVRPPIPPLLVDTPKSSRTDTKEGPRKMRGKKEEGESSRVPLSLRWKEQEQKQATRCHLVDGSSVLDTLTPMGGRYLEDSVGMDTFNGGIGRDEGTRMNSTRKSDALGGGFGKTFVVKDGNRGGNFGNTFVKVGKRKTKPFLPLLKEETTDSTHVVVPAKIEERNTPKRDTTPRLPRLTRNMARPPSRSPSRTRRPSFVIPPSPSRSNPKKSPTRSRPPPKPMPRMLGLEVQSQATAVGMGGPVPAPRRAMGLPVGPPAPAPRRAMDSRVEGREGAEEEGGEEYSPASLFQTQPRLREERRMEKSEITPEDRSNIEMLNSLREEIRTRKSNQLWSGDLDLLRQMIVEKSLHLKPYF